MVFNYQDMHNFQVLRFKGNAADWQLLACVDGQWDVLDRSSIHGLFAEDRFYTLTVTSADNRVFGFSLKDSASGEVLADGAVADDRFAEGFAGVYLDMETLGHNAKFDDFKFTAHP